MKNKAFKILFLIIVFMFVLLLCGQGTFAVEKLNPNDYQTTLNPEEATDIFKMGSIVVKVLRNVAAVVAVLVISIIGVRYIVGSAEEKAEYKEIMIPVVVGCIFIASLSGILTLIQSIF